jgi:hypothetical protein
VPADPLEVTRPDHSWDAHERREVPVLVYVGSAENGFAEAGRIIDLDEVGRVRFGRITGPRGIELEREPRLLHVGIGLPWVSAAHAELSILGSGDGAHVVHLTDLGSRNGTNVEGRPVGRHRLEPGELFEIGRSFWILRRVGTRELKSLGRAPAGLGPTASPRLSRLLVDLERIADTDAAILLSGETATGKDRLARALHAASGRPGAFVRINFAASAGTVEPALAAARGGTLYLDELGETTPAAQAELLELVARVGPPANAEPGPRLDLRIIAATTRDLHGMAAIGTFRPDLLALLRGYDARLLPLRERREDLGLLVRELTLHEPRLRVTTRAFRRLCGHPWPFNLRELEQTLRAAAAVSDPDDTVTARGVEKILARAGADAPTARSVQAIREQLVALLVRHGGDTDAIAQALRCPTPDAQAWLRRFELRPEDWAARA